MDDTKLLFSALSSISEKLSLHRGSCNGLAAVLRSLEAEYLREDLGWVLGQGRGHCNSDSISSSSSSGGVEWNERLDMVRERLDGLARVEDGMVS